MSDDENSEHYWPLADLIAVVRTTLVEHGVWRNRRDDRTGKRYPPTLEGEDDGRIYPFTKGLDLTNDGIGYGEATTVRVLAKGGASEIQTRRRTRTGSIVIDPEPVVAPREDVSSTFTKVTPQGKA